MDVKKILFNALQYEANGAGISRYTKRVMETFIEQDYPIDILIRNELADVYHNEHVIPIEGAIGSSAKRIMEEQLIQRKRYKEYGLVHFPDYATPLFYKGPKVATIHDMAMHTMRDKRTLMQNITKSTLLGYTIKTAEHLICVSEFSKKELYKYYPHIKAKVSVIHEGIDIPKYKFTSEKEDAILNKFSIRCPYILFVGTLAPHKNIIHLIRSFAILKKEKLDYQLIIVGKKGWMYDEIFNEVKVLGLEKSIIFTDFITNEELEVFYQKATLFVSVSLYEGFGLPPLEAMGRGCPTLVSNLEVFKETCEESVFYCDPMDVNDIAKTMIHILENETLRKKLSTLGMKRAQKYNWKQTAKETFEVYKQILEVR